MLHVAIQVTYFVYVNRYITCDYHKLYRVCIYFMFYVVFSIVAYFMLHVAQAYIVYNCTLSIICSYII